MLFKTRIFLFMIIFIILASSLFADNEFIIESFKAIPNDMAGSIHSKKDGNNEYCALIKVKTGINKDLDFDSGLKFNPFEKNKPGEYWVYVSPGEGRLTLFAEGFTPKHFQITTEKIESKRTYEMIVRAKEEEKISVVILTDPADAEKLLDGKSLGRGDNFQVAQGEYILTVKKHRFYDYQASITVNNDNTLFKDIQLIPIEKTKLSILSEPVKADIYIDDIYSGRTNMEIFLFPGTYNLMLIKEGYVEKAQIVEVREKKSQTLKLHLERKKSSLQVSISPMEAACRLIENGEEVISWTGANYLQNIPVGEYELICICDGYKTEKQNIKIRENEIQSIVINMEEEISKAISKYKKEIVNFKNTYSFGLRGVFGVSASLRVPAGESKAIEGIFSLYNSGLMVTGMYQWHNPIGDVENLSWYYGGGIHAGLSWFWTNALSLGIDGIVGIEYDFESLIYLPLKLSFDYKPAYSFIGSWGNNWYGFAGTIRYVF